MLTVSAAHLLSGSLSILDWIVVLFIFLAGVPKNHTELNPGNFPGFSSVRFLGELGRSCSRHASHRIRIWAGIAVAIVPWAVAAVA